MHIMLEAIYRNGVLVPDRSLGAENEGKKFKLIVVEEKVPATEIELFLRFVEAHSFNLPGDYRFNRDEIYER